MWGESGVHTRLQCCNAAAKSCTAAGLVRLLQSVRFTLQWELPTPALLCMLCKMTPFFLVIHATRQALLRTVKALLIIAVKCGALAPVIEQDTHAPSTVTW